MRIRAAWAWIPLAITIAGVVYLSMVKLSIYQAASRETQVIREAPKPFVPPPAPVRHSAATIPDPPSIEPKPVRPASPLPDLQLPPFTSPHK